MRYPRHSPGYPLAPEEIFLVTAELRNSLAALRNAARVLSLVGRGDARLLWLGGVLDRQVTRLSEVADELRWAVARDEEEEEEAPALPPGPSREHGIYPALFKHRVLVVDDNVDGAESLAMILRLAGHVVHTVHDGPDGLAAAHWFHPDVVLLDLGLPGMDGWEVARHLHDSEGLKKEQIIAITGFDREELRQRSAAAGIGQHLVKPVDPAQLEDLLAKLPVPTPE